MKKNTLIFLYPYRFRTFDRKRFEIPCLKESFDIEIFELIEYLHPKFCISYMTQDKSEDIKRFDSFTNFKDSFEELLKETGDRVYVLNFIPVTNFRELKVNNFLRSKSLRTIAFNNPGVPPIIASSSVFENISLKLGFMKNRGTIKLFVNLFIEFTVRLISSLNKVKPDFLISAGSIYTKDIKNEILGNSFDYNTFLELEKNPKSQKKYIVFLDTGSPYFNTDTLLRQTKKPHSIEKWYPALRKFFDQIEELLDMPVLILAHPKHKYTDKDKQKTFGDRKVIHGKTPEMIQSSSLVLATNSTAVSFAVLAKLPICILRSDEICRDKYMNSYLDSSSINLGCPIVNIDNQFHFSKSFFTKVDHKLYDLYVKKFLSSRDDEKTLCQIFREEFNN